MIVSFCISISPCMSTDRLVALQLCIFYLSSSVSIAVLLFEAEVLCTLRRSDVFLARLFSIGHELSYSLPLYL
jgi:hypothetical protein